MGLGRIKGNPFWSEFWYESKKYVGAMLILDHVSITLQCNHKQVLVSMVYKTADSRKWLFINFVMYATHSLQFLLCFDKEFLLLDLKLYIINSVVVVFFLFTCKNILWSPKRFCHNDIIICIIYCTSSEQNKEFCL